MKNFIILIFLMSPACIFSQGNPFAVWENQQTSTYWLVRLDAATGFKTDLYPLSGVTAFVAGSKTAFNTDSMHYHFAGLNGATLRYYTIDVQTGNVLYSPVLSDNIIGMHYNCNDSLLYGMRGSGNVYDLITLNPASGLMNVIGPVSGISAYVTESFSFDPVQQYFNLVVISGATKFLRTYFAKTGALVNNNAFPDQVTGHRYSCADSALYGLWEDSGVYKLEKVFPQTGTHTTVGTLAGVTPGFVLESACMNQAGIYTYRGFDTSNTFSIISIDVSSGAVLSISNTTDNAVGFEEGICCYSTLTSAEELLNSEQYELLIHPIPGYGSVNIACARSIESIRICSPSGIIINTFSPDKPALNFELDIADLEGGIYFLNIRLDSGKTILKKIVKL